GRVTVTGLSVERAAETGIFAQGAVLTGRTVRLLDCKRAGVVLLDTRINLSAANVTSCGVGVVVGKDVGGELSGCSVTGNPGGGWRVVSAGALRVRGGRVGGTGGPAVFPGPATGVRFAAHVGPLPDTAQVAVTATTGPAPAPASEPGAGADTPAGR